MVNLKKTKEEQEIEDLRKEIVYVAKFIKYIEEGYGKKICMHKGKRDYHPDCGNCQAQWALGWLRNHQSLLEWDLQEKTKKHV